LSSIIGRGVEQGVFRQDINVEATVTALMAQIKGIGYHATLGKRKRGGLWCEGAALTSDPTFHPMGELLEQGDAVCRLRVHQAKTTPVIELLL